MRYLGIIPARAGSKGIPKKNMTLLNGHPLIWHTINSAQKSQLRNSLFLTSESNEIIDYCRSLGLVVEYRRPDALATDEATVVDVIIHCIEHLVSKRQKPEAIVLLQPTSPLRTPEEIDAALRIFEQQNLNSLVGVNVMREHPYECISGSFNGGWSYLKKPQTHVTRRQDFQEKFFYINGAMYIVNTDYFIEHRRFVTEGETFLFEMSQGNAIDIDEPIDLFMADTYLKKMEAHG